MGSKKRNNTSRSAEKQARRRKRQSRNTRGILPGPTYGLTTPDTQDYWGLVQSAPSMTVAEHQRRTESGLPIPEEIELVDPILGQALKRRSTRWVDYGEPSNSLWDLDGSADPAEEYAQPLYISLDAQGGTPRWKVYYPSLDDSARDPDEVFETREDLLNAVDRLESRFPNRETEN